MRKTACDVTNNVRGSLERREPDYSGENTRK
jgi:hypothetical protein